MLGVLCGRHCLHKLIRRVAQLGHRAWHGDVTQLEHGGGGATVKFSSLGVIFPTTLTLCMVLVEGPWELSGLVQSSRFTQRETEAHREALISPRAPGR